MRPRVVDLDWFRLDFGSAHFGLWVGPLSLTVLRPSALWAFDWWSFDRVSGACWKLRLWFVVLTWWRRL